MFVITAAFSITWLVYLPETKCDSAIFLPEDCQLFPYKVISQGLHPSRLPITAHPYLIWTAPPHNLGPYSMTLWTSALESLRWTGGSRITGQVLGFLTLGGSANFGIRFLYILCYILKMIEGKIEIMQTRKKHHFKKVIKGHFHTCFSFLASPK